ncbi:uncharacterized protein LOC144451420 [Glandiceps talaboti]
METGEKIERIPLEHPLPKEIQKMQRDETVCQFCGVSYLIHREIKELEDKIVKLEKDLAKYVGIEEREAKLRNELQVTKSSNEQLQKMSTDLSNKLTAITEEKTTKEKELESQRRVGKELEEKLAKQIGDSEKLKLHHSRLQRSLPGIMTIIQKQKSSLQNIQTFVEQRNRLVNESIQHLKTTVNSVNSHEKQRGEKLQQRIEKLERELEEYKESKATIESALKTTQSEIEKSRQTDIQCQQLEKMCEELSSDMKKLLNELETERTNYRMSSSEAAQYKQLLRNKSQEVDDLNVQVRKRDQISEHSMLKLQKEIKQKDDELKSITRECQVLKRKVQEQERLDQEIQRKAAMSVGETEELKSVLVKTREELEGLKAERELMVSSHQNRIEQLRESFKQKLADAERWPSKMHDNLQKERDKHSTEKRELEEKLKQSFTMELEIERQKHQELLDKYKKDYESQFNQLRNEMRSLNGRHRAELSRLEKQITEAKQQGNANESSWKQEIQSLKNIITDLEDRLAKCGNESDGAVTNLKAELQESEQDLDSAKRDIKELEEQLEQFKEEISFLQDTVRRECEERYELTEALSEAKEQLLTFQRPAAGYNSSRPSSGQKTFIKSSESNIMKKKTSTGSLGGLTSAGSDSLNQSSSGTTLNSQNSTGKLGGQSPANQAGKLSGQNPGRGSPVGKLNVQNAGSPVGRNQVNATSRIMSNNVSVGFEGVGMQPNKPTNTRPKEGSVDDSRQRIAAAVGRH